MYELQSIDEGNKKRIQRQVLQEENREMMAFNRKKDLMKQLRDRSKNQSIIIQEIERIKKEDQT